MEDTVSSINPYLLEVIAAQNKTLRKLTDALQAAHEDIEQLKHDLRVIDQASPITPNVKCIYQAGEVIITGEPVCVDNDTGRIIVAKPGDDRPIAIAVDDLSRGDQVVVVTGVAMKGKSNAEE